MASPAAEEALCQGQQLEHECTRWSLESFRFRCIFVMPVAASGGMPMVRPSLVPCPDCDIARINTTYNKIVQNTVVSAAGAKALSPRAMAWISSRSSACGRSCNQHLHCLKPSENCTALFGWPQGSGMQYTREGRCAKLPSHLHERQDLATPKLLDLCYSSLAVSRRGMLQRGQACCPGTRIRSMELLFPCTTQVHPQPCLVMGHTAGRHCEDDTT